MRPYILFLLIFLVSSCSKSIHQATSSDDTLINLSESTNIIRTLIQSNKLHEIFQEYDPAALTQLMNNVSPAGMAFESEVFNTTVPLVMVYYYKNSPQAQAFINDLKALAIEYDNRMKIVTADADQLFSVAQDAHIEAFPAVLFVQGRTIIARLEGVITRDLLIQHYNEIHSLA